MTASRRAVALAAALSLAACMVGPNYQRPPPADPPVAAFKETTGPVVGGADNFRPAQPRDAIDRGPWWTMYGDPVLDRLAAQVDISNQTLMQAEAAYRQARALVRQDASGLYPTVSGNAGFTQSGSGSGSGRSTARRRRQHRAAGSLEPIHRGPVARLAGRPVGPHPPPDRKRFGGCPGQRRRPRQSPGCRRRPTSRSTTSRCASPSSASCSSRRRSRPLPAPCRSCRTSSMPASSRASTWRRRRPSSSRRAPSSSPRTSTVPSSNMRWPSWSASRRRLSPSSPARRRRTTCRRSMPGCRRRCSSGGPISPPPNA